MAQRYARTVSFQESLKVCKRTPGQQGKCLIIVEMMIKLPGFELDSSCYYHVFLDFIFHPAFFLPGILRQEMKGFFKVSLSKLKLLMYLTQQWGMAFLKALVRIITLDEGIA